MAGLWSGPRPAPALGPQVLRRMVDGFLQRPPGGPTDSEALAVLIAHRHGLVTD